jgi:glycosyltransferase involved in cell wall biosynthesis
MKLSIITVNLNNKSGLIDTAKSIVAQTWTDYEWIIIDGGSTDGSVDVIKEYAEKTNKLVYWCSEPDGGVFQAMNKGIDIAVGDWLNFMNSGDCFYNKTTLQNVFETENMDADIIYGDTIRIYSFGPFLERARAIDNSMKKRMPFVHQSSFVKTELMKKCKFDETYRICGDQKYFCDCYINNKKFIYRPLVIAVFNSKYGMSSSNYLLVDYELARINGIENKITWKIKYRIYCNIKALIKRMLPKFIVQKIEVGIYIRQYAPLKSLFL